MKHRINIISLKLIVGLLTLVAFVLAGPIQAAGGGKPEIERFEFVEEYDLADRGRGFIAEACGIDTVNAVDNSAVQNIIFPNGTFTTHLKEDAVWTNPDTGDQVYIFISITQIDEAAIISQDGDIETTVFNLSVSGLGQKIMRPDGGAIASKAGRFEATLTIVLDVSTEPPTFISIEETLGKVAGTIRDDLSDKEFTELCEALGGSYSP